MPAHIVHGDPFLAIRRIRDIKTEAGLTNPSRYAEQRFEASQADAVVVTGAVRAPPFLEDARVTIVAGALTTRERGQQRGNQPWETLADAIPIMPAANLLILVDARVTKSNPLLRRLTAHCAMHEVPAPTGNSLTRWVEELAREKGSRIRANAARAVVEAANSDLWSIDQEMDKLSLYCHSGEITVDDVSRVTGQARQANIFAAMDAIVERRPGDALQTLAKLMKEGSEPRGLMGMINRQLRLIAMAQDLTGRNVPQSRWEKSWGFTSEFVARKTAGQAARLTKNQIDDMYAMAVEADFSIKTGRAEPAQAVEMLAAQLASMR